MNRVGSFLILGGSATPGCEALPYRGVYRANPTFQPALPEDHKVNRAFKWFCEEGGESGTVSDIRRARELVDLYRGMSPPQVFEIIEPVPGGSQPGLASQFLGWDVAVGGIGFSFLSCGLPPPKGRPRIGALSPVLALMDSYFGAKLNANGLFEDSKDGQFYWECMRSLQELLPALWTSEPFERIQIVGVYLVV